MMEQISLSGQWDFRFEDDADWRPIPVPGCWEMLDVPKDRAGPAWYRTRAVVPPTFAGRRIWLRFGAVSYACAVYMNGSEVGRHIGLWDAFDVEIGDAVRAGEKAEILVRVEKPASPRRGPGSEPVPGTYPLQETLAGFLPYVWGQIFGGIWQDVALAATGRVVFEDVCVRGTAAGEIAVEYALSGPADVTVRIIAPDGALILTKTLSCDGSLRLQEALDDPQLWSPAGPALYTAQLSVPDGDERTLRFGLRSLTVEGSTVRLNGQPLYPRMALSWGWYPDALNSNPGLTRVREELERLRQLGYNGVKLCLWIPPPYYFDLADELGMLLWVELPMWLTRPTAFFRRQVRGEYERLLRAVRSHPAVVVYSLGCELNREIGAEILRPLYQLAKSLAGDALVRDNSGSGEAYGGLLNEFADYYDYHFYSDIQFLRNLLDYFSPRWRPELPWLFGEFCDLDTFRDLRQLSAANGGKPWWTLADPRNNPQGARWQFDVVDQEARLRENGFWERGAEIERISHRQALLHRKFTLELVRSYREISGYVVTGEADTPISTSGMWDETGRLKFEPDEFRAFNDDIVLLAGWDKRRAWIAGGDRTAYWDVWSYAGGDVVRAHLLVSHYGAAAAEAELDWQISFDGEEPFAEGKASSGRPVAPGSVREITVAEFRVPDVGAPRRATLRAAARLGAQGAENRWPLWLFPRSAWSDIAPFALIDPANRLADLRQIAPAVVDNLQGGATAIATAWTVDVAAFVAAGGSAILLQGSRGPAGPIPTAEMPFWREAIKIPEPHPAWHDFPHDGWVSLQFFGCATDYAIDTAAFAGRLAPILRRLDARTMRLHDYAVEIAWGRGRAIVSTLRFEGGQGEQPLGISRNTAAAYLLSCWVRYLQSAGHAPIDGRPESQGRTPTPGAC